MNYLAGLADLRRHLNLQPDDTGDDPRLFEALQTASHAVETICARHFVPRFQTLIQRLPHAASEITLESDLLEIISMADEGGGIVLDEIEPCPLPGSASVLRRTDGGVFTGTLMIEGWWGWHDSLDHLWLRANDTVRSDPLDFDASVLEVLAVNGEDASGRAPRFQAGQLIRVGDEVMGVLKADSDTNLLALERGANGTQSVTHLRGAQISIYQPPAVVRDLALRLAAWLVQHAEPPPEPLITALQPFRRLQVK